MSASNQMQHSRCLDGFNEFEVVSKKIITRSLGLFRQIFVYAYERMKCFSSSAPIADAATYASDTFISPKMTHVNE